MPTGPPFHSYQISSYGAHKDVSTDSCFREDNNIMKKVRVVSLACDMPTGFPLHPYQILSQTVWELWPAQDFCFRRDNYITKKVRVASLAGNMPTCPPLHYHQILPKYV